MRKYSKLLVAAVLLLLPVIALNAAELTGRVTATVVDEEGNPVADARVEFISPSLMGERVQNTDADGRLTSSLLPVGAYAVTVSAPGKQTVTLSLRVGVGQAVPLSVTLKSGEDLVEEVVVYGAATKLETTAGGENFNYDTAIEGLPIQNRAIEGVASFAPNVSFGPTPGTLSISGAPSFDTVVMLDGAEMSDPYFGSAPTLFLEDAIEEVQVLTSGVSARYGRFQGGVISAITKSGGNTFDGVVRYEFSKESWNGQTPFGEDQSDELTEAYQGTLGGFFVKDRLWFFGGYRTIPQSATSNTALGTGESFTTTRDEERFQLKLRGAITPNHVLEASYLEYTSTATGRAGLPAYDLFAATGVRDDPRDITTLSYQGVLTSSVYLDLLYTDKNVSIKSGGDPALGSPILYAGNELPGFGIFNNHWWDYNDASVRDNETIGANLTQVVSTSDWGEHTLEYGVQYVKSTTGGENRQSSTGFNLLAYDLDGSLSFVNLTEGGDPTFNLESYYDDGRQIAYRWEALPLGGVQEIENTAAYIQDSWQIDRWRFDVGLRYEEYSGKGPLPTVNIDFKDISPRLGVTYNIDANWQVVGSYGKYISRINDNVASNVTGVGGAPLISSIYDGPAFNDLTYDEVETILRDDDNWVINAVYDPSQPTVLLDPDLEAPYANDFNLAVKRALPRNTGSFTLTYVNREFKNLLDDYVGDEGVVTITEPGNPSNELGDFDLKRWYNCDTCQRDYQAVAATFEYRPGATWNLGGNWTWSETRGNYEGEGRNTPSSGSIIGNYPESVNQQLAIPLGLVDEDITHRVAAWGNYRFDFDRFGSLNIGSIATYQSGRVWSRTASVPLTNSPNYLNDTGSFTGYFDGRGQNRFSGWWSLDLSARYAFPIFRDDVSGWFKVNAINVLGNDELTSYTVTGSRTTGDGGQLEWQPSGSFGNTTSQNNYQQPRTYLFTLGVQF